MVEFSLPNTWPELVSLKPKLMNDDRDNFRSLLSNFIYLSYLQLLPKRLRLYIISCQIGPNQIKLTPNNFPYNYLLKNLPKIKHLCLWSRHQELPSTQIDQIISSTYPGLKYFWYQNPTGKRSVPEICHYHVFVDTQ